VRSFQPGGDNAGNKRAAIWRGTFQRRARPPCADPYFGLEAAPLMYIPTKTPRKLDRKRSKLLRSKFKAKNRGRRQQLKK